SQRLHFSYISRQRQSSSVQGPAYLDVARSKGRARRQDEEEAVIAAADARAFKILPIAVGEHLTGQLAVDENIETDRCAGVIDGLRPTNDPVRARFVDMAAQCTDTLAVRGAQQAGAQRDAPPRRSDHKALRQARRTITPGRSTRRGIE